MKSKDGRNAYNILKTLNNIDKELLKNSIKIIRISFVFAVNSKYRGKGNGKQLFKALLQYMKKGKYK